MRVIGLDIGEKRIGVAVSDPSQTVASPLVVLDAARVRGDARELLRLVEDYEAGCIVVGLPLSLDGTEGPQATHVRVVAARLASVIPIPFEYFDERHSSSQARRALTLGGVSERRQRGAVDSVAAALFLQNYLDSRRPPGEGVTDDAGVV
ncbi:MAG: Holliday junction resolvase RuvX [Actinobacteria bacterium HGW-Actinobacteria-7]|nr:MAG: Holliday junction resolvase RuvX [Actinobacteria bacterium HGW-Actinobacteria-7]